MLKWAFAVPYVDEVLPECLADLDYIGDDSKGSLKMRF